jgi:hypothetical protein
MHNILFSFVVKFWFFLIEIDDLKFNFCCRCSSIDWNGNRTHFRRGYQRPQPRIFSKPIQKWCRRKRTHWIVRDQSVCIWQRFWRKRAHQVIIQMSNYNFIQYIITSTKMTIKIIYVLRLLSGINWKTTRTSSESIPALEKSSRKLN